MNKSRQQKLTHKTRLAKARNQQAKDFYYGHWQTDKRERNKLAKRRANRLGTNLGLLTAAMRADEKYHISLNDIASLDRMSYDLLRIK